MAQTLGITDISWDNNNLQVEKGATIKLAGLKSSPVVNGRRVDYANEYMQGEVTATISLLRGKKLSDYLPSGEKELQVICDTGQHFTMQAFLTEPPTATGGEGGKIKLTWNFGAFEETLDD